MLSIPRTLVALAAVAAVRAQPYNSSCVSSTATQPVATAGTTPQLFSDLFSAPTAIKRFQRLLVQGGSLLTGEALRRVIVFDFNGAQPANGALGGVVKLAVSITVEGFCYHVDELLSTEYRNLSLCY